MKNIKQGRLAEVAQVYKSYLVRYWSTNGKPLLGGVMESQSSRWGERSDAEHYAQVVIKNNGDHCKTKIVVSDKYPQIFRHCADPEKPAAAIGGRCFTCKKMLGVSDAIAFKEPS